MLSSGELLLTAPVKKPRWTGVISAHVKHGPTDVSWAHPKCLDTDIVLEGRLPREYLKSLVGQNNP